MSGVDIIGALLFAHAPLIARVPRSKIKVEEVPEDSTPPYIILEHVTGSDRKVLHQGPKRHRRHRVRVTSCAGNIADRDEILDLIRDACADRLGDFAGATEVTVQLDMEGAAIKVRPANIYTRGQDFQVSFNQAA